MSDRARPALVEGLTLAIMRLRALGEHAAADEAFNAVVERSGAASTDLLISLSEASRKARRESKQISRETAPR
jgi:hypothetical protein